MSEQERRVAGASRNEVTMANADRMGENADGSITGTLARLEEAALVRPIYQDDTDWLLGAASDHRAAPESERLAGLLERARAEERAKCVEELRRRAASFHGLGAFQEALMTAADARQLELSGEEGLFGNFC